MNFSNRVLVSVFVVVVMGFVKIRAAAPPPVEDGTVDTGDEGGAVTPVGGGDTGGDSVGVGFGHQEPGGSAAQAYEDQQSKLVVSQQGSNYNISVVGENGQFMNMNSPQPAQMEYTGIESGQVSGMGMMGGLSLP